MFKLLLTTLFIIGNGRQSRLHTSLTIAEDEPSVPEIKMITERGAMTHRLPSKEFTSYLFEALILTSNSELEADNPFIVANDREGTGILGDREQQPVGVEHTILPSTMMRRPQIGRSLLLGKLKNGLEKKIDRKKRLKAALMEYILYYGSILTLFLISGFCCQTSILRSLKAIQRHMNTFQRHISRQNVLILHSMLDEDESYSSDCITRADNYMKKILLGPVITEMESNLQNL
ncbi:MAG: hypothetical protein AAF335_03960 [Bacteroidota bacterium]